MNELTKLKNLLNTLKSNLDEKYIIYDDVNLIYIINYEKLIEIFPFEALIKYCNNKNITLNNLESFLDENDSNKSSNKIGKVAIIFPLLYGMYDIQYLSKETAVGNYIYKIIYGYNWINNIGIKKQIGPKRIAFMVCDLVKKNINNHFPNLLDVEFEKIIDDGTHFRYDIAIALSKKLLEECNINDEYKIIIVIEIQENSSNHIFNPNDNKKNYIVNSNGIIIKYFFENKIKEDNYESNFYADILHVCNEVLISVSENYRNNNLLLETQIIGKREIIKLTEELKYIDSEQQEFVNINIERWKLMNDDLDNTTKQVKQIYKYKREAFENKNKSIFSDHNIPAVLIFNNLRIKLNKSKKYYEQLKKLVSIYCRTIENELYFSYKSLNNFIVELNIDGNYKLKLHFNNILLCTQEIYEYYINIIQKYNESIISKLRNNNKIIKDIITEKIEKKYSIVIKNYEINNNIKEYQIKNLMSILEKKKIKPNRNIIISLDDNSIFIKDSDLHIYFSKDREKNISSLQVLALMLNEGLKKNESIKLLNKFYKNFTDCRKLEFIENETIPHLYYNNNL